MPALCSDERLWLFVIAGVAGALFALMQIPLGPNILAWFIRPEKPPEPRHPALWAVMALAGLTAIVGTAVASTAPARSCVAVSIPALDCAPQGEGQALQGEYVQLQNDGRTSLAMKDWTLCDLDGIHCFVFADFTLASGASVKVWSGTGVDTASDLYWAQKQSVWNNAGDVAILKDPEGRTIIEKACP